MFWTRTPEGFAGVSEVELKDGKVHIRDDHSEQAMTLSASRGL